MMKRREFMQGALALFGIAAVAVKAAEPESTGVVFDLSVFSVEEARRLVDSLRKMTADERRMVVLPSGVDWWYG